MRKRLFSYLLAAALLLTLIPFGAVRAEAASEFVASTELVEVIKKWEGFCAKPIWDYGQWSVGYGTRAPDEHLARYRAEGISQEEATQLLMGYMESMGKSVNSFIDKFGLKVNQAQFDAMVSLTYNCGGRWMLEPSSLRTSVIEGWEASEFVYIWGQWSTAGGETLPILVRRRLAEANMFLNGVYSNSPPSNYYYVRFDANGGTRDVKTQSFIAGDPVDIRSTATYEGCKFLGWYTDPTGGEKIEKLDSSLNGYILYAHWGAGNGAGQPQDTPAQTVTGTPVNYSRQVLSATLNAFDQPVKGALVVDAFLQGDIVNIVAEHVDTAGVKWGKVKNVGWINLSYTQEPSDDTQQGGVSVKVTGSDVNIRRGPGTAYAAVGKANVGDVLVITQTATGGGYTWGKSNRGWIALKYTNYDEAVNGNIKDETSTQEPVMGTVNVQEFLRVRSAPGVANAVVGMLGPKDRVKILEQKAVGGMIWGRIDKGWISLDYVILDKPGTEKPEETKPEETTPPTTTPEETKPTEPPKQETPAVTGKVKLSSGRLNVRSGPSTGYSVVSSYANGTAVTILEQKTVGTVTWGRTDKGWISLDYVKLDQQQTETPAPEQKPEETTPPATTPEQTTPEQKPEVKPEEKPTETKTETGTVSLTSGCLRIRSGAGTGYAITGNLYNGAKVTITERKSVGTTQWGKTDKGWICLDYVKFSTAGNTGNTGNQNTNTGNQNNNTGSNNSTSEKLTGSVNVNDFLRIRSGAGTNYSVVGYYHKNDKVTITEQKTVGGTKWGRTNKGWISLDYVILDGQTSAAPETTGTAGTVTGTGLRIRSGAGTTNRIVGSLTIGDKVTILETTTVGNTKWGRIEKGWICLDYVKLG